MRMDEFVNGIPKAELNIHIEGALEPDLILELAKRNKITLPFADVSEIQKSYQFSDLQSFLKIYYEFLTVLQTEQDFYDLMTAYLQKAAAQNIRHVEIFFDPQAHTTRGIAFETVINGLYRAITDQQKKLNISAYLIMCFMRDHTAEEAQQTLQSALGFKDWIVAVGLDSAEIGNPPEKFADVFASARDAGFLTVAIAGETGPPEYIYQAIDILKVSRIDHGVACMQDPDLLARLSATQIPLTVCPVSNVKLGIFPSLRHHPLKKMYDDGLFVTVNSDDPVYFNANLNENFLQIHAALKLNKAIIYELVKNSFNASFLDHAYKQKLITELDKFYKQASMKVL